MNDAEATRSGRLGTRSRRRGWFRRPRLVLAASLVAGIALVGCSDGEERSTSAGEVPRSANLDVVERLQTHFERAIDREAQRRAESGAIRGLLREQGGSSGESGDEMLQHRPALRAVYGGRDYEPIWHIPSERTTRVSPHAAKLRKMLIEGVRSHGLWAKDLHIQAVRVLEDQGLQCCAELESLRLREDERDALLEHLTREGRDLEGEEGVEELASIVADPEGPTPRIAEAVGAQTEQLKGAAETIARRDLRLTDALAEYLVEMRYSNTAWHQPRAWRSTFRKGSVGPLRAVTIAGKAFEETPAEAMQDAVETARERAMTVATLREAAEEPERVDALMREVQPPYRQYDRLVDAFRTYRSIVERGGWPEVPERAIGLKRGYYSDAVRLLKHRLRVEGYWEPPEESDDGAGEGEGLRRPSKKYDASLEEAVRTYQQTHQLYVRGSVTEQTLRSLNVTARERWNQLRVTLERWRESRVGADEHYVHANIADFHAEVWREGEREMRFRVITGSSERERDDETGEVRYPRATPQFSDTLEYIVFNPYWNVPESIRQNELKPKLAKNPSYFEENNYEIVTDEHGREFVRQKPGPQNALGRVKFLFPNEYSVYMHDTPEKHLFSVPTRGYSHGCIRIQDPMEFAHYLLDLDGRWMGKERKEQIEEWFEKDGETWISLRVSLPVHIEYFVVRVDDDGWANFLADLYDHDEKRLTAVEERLDAYPDDYDLPKATLDDLLASALRGDLEQTSRVVP